MRNLTADGLLRREGRGGVWGGDGGWQGGGSRDVTMTCTVEQLQVSNPTPYALTQPRPRDWDGVPPTRAPRDFRPADGGARGARTCRDS